MKAVQFKKYGIPENVLKVKEVDTPIPKSDEVLVKILINGEAGGVGTLGVQLAKHNDCEVTGVDSGEKLEQMKSIGFDFVIDYKKTNFTKNGETYDLILDCKTNQFLWSYLMVLRPDGIYVTIGGKPAGLLNILFFGKIISAFSSKKLQILSLKPNKDLGYFLELFKQNSLKVRIDGPYTLDDIPKLIQYFGEGKHNGKIVIRTDRVHDFQALKKP